VTPAEKIQRTIRRSKAFYAATTPGHFLIQTRFPHDRPAMPALTDFDLDRELERWLDHQLECSRATWAAGADLDDDRVPCLCPRFGIAEHSAWLGSEVLLQHDTCLPIPLIVDKKDLQRVRCDEHNRWFQYMQRGYRYLKTRQSGDFLLSVRGTMAPMDIANALRGDELFYDFYDDTAFVHRLMRFLSTAVLWYYRHLLSWADEVEGGYAMFLSDFWFPAGLGHLSNDAAMLCNAQIYEVFGFPYEREMCLQFPHTLYHVHNEKMHFVPRVAELPGMRLLQVSWDPKTPCHLLDRDHIFSATGQAALMLHVTDSDHLREHITELSGRNIFFIADCRDHQDAADLIALVRSRSKPFRFTY